LFQAKGNIMTPDDMDTIGNWVSGQKSFGTMTLAPADEPAGDHLTAFYTAFKDLTPLLKAKKDSDDPFQAPALIIGRHQNIAYQAVPAGKELAPFLQAMTMAAEETVGLSRELDTQLQRIEVPVQLKLYIALQCPHCPLVVQRMLPLASASPMIRLTVIDAQLFEEKARADQIRSVPTLILDDALRWTGQVDVDEILKLCIERDPSAMSPASLRQILDAGDAARAAAMMRQQGKVFPALVELLIHPRWSVRLGAMVTVEYLADETPALAAELADALWSRFHDLTEQVQGDVLHVIGLSRTASARAYLEKVMSGDYPVEVKEAAEEALEEIATNE
jgi:hypothetical protein